MVNISTDTEGMKLRDFLEKFIFFHLGRDAEVDLLISPGGLVSCSIRHSRIKVISFELDANQTKVFSEDLPAFEDYLLELLTLNRRGGGILD